MALTETVKEIPYADFNVNNVAATLDGTLAVFEAGVTIQDKMT
jgi:hypothetical protein